MDYEVEENEIIAISSKQIAVNIDGKIHIFSRYCPHEGADLSMGYVRDGKVRCPWHNLPFDEDGKNPCKCLKNLRKEV